MSNEIFFMLFKSLQVYIYIYICMCVCAKIFIIFVGPKGEKEVNISK